MHRPVILWKVQLFDLLWYYFYFCSQKIFGITKISMIAYVFMAVGEGVPVFFEASCAVYLELEFGSK